MRIIITGGAGFIGSSLADALVGRGDEVLAVDNFCDFYDPAVKRRNIAEVAAKGCDKFRLVEADIRDVSAMNEIFAEYRPDVTVHLAAMAGVRPSIADPALYEKLRALRAKLAAASRVPAYVIFSDATLRDMTRRMPLTADEFLLVSGVGQTKTARYARTFIAVIRGHVDESREKNGG